jgi:hypothetical protein
MSKQGEIVVGDIFESKEARFIVDHVGQGDLGTQTIKFCKGLSEGTTYSSLEKIYAMRFIGNVFEL